MRRGVPARPGCRGSREDALDLPQEAFALRVPRTTHAGSDAGLKNIVGGEIQEYTKLMAESREQAIDRVIALATSRGVIVNVRGTRGFSSANSRGKRHALSCMRFSRV